MFHKSVLISSIKEAITSLVGLNLDRIYKWINLGCLKVHHPSLLSCTPSWSLQIVERQAHSWEEASDLLSTPMHLFPWK